MIDSVTVERIKAAADIVDVVSDYVRLHRRGSNLMGLCPFHNERTPSFSVNKAKNFCWCFSCKKGGGPVNFLMEKEGYSYAEALRKLAERYGIEVVETLPDNREDEEREKRERMFAANDWAMRKMESDLFDTEEGRAIGLEYFYHRGVTDEAIKAFHLGYAIDNGSALTTAAKTAGFDLQTFRDVGLIGKSERGNLYDRFRGRVIFPILNQTGRVAGFGGRTLKKDDKAKYINSPESEIYKKSYQLYGLTQARAAIRKEDRSFLVEGYMDVIGMWQSGMQNVVASSGTALTEGQITILKRLSENITLIYDGDAPGIKAALRGMDMLLAAGMNTKVLLLPDGEDPDSFARKNTPEAFREYVEQNETDIIRFKIKVLLGESEADPLKRGDAIRSVVESIAQIPDRIQRDIYAQECAQLMEMPLNTIIVATADARKKIEKQQRIQSGHKDLDRFIDKEHKVSSTDQRTAVRPDTNGTQQPPAMQTPDSSSSTGPVIQLNADEVIRRRQLYPLELTIACYLVKYGMLLAGTMQYDDGSEQEVKVWEYIKMQFENDDMGFHEPVFTKLFDRILDLIKEYPELRERNTSTIEKEIESERKSGFDEIASKSLDMAAIELEEKRLEERLEALRAQRLMEFDRNFVEQQLYNDEDDEIRSLVTSIMIEPHQLSNIYIKTGNVEKDEDRLNVIVSRAMVEWKTELLDLRLKDMMREFGKLDPADEAAVSLLQREMNDIIHLRSEIAKSIGDRILAPGR